MWGLLDLINDFFGIFPWYYGPFFKSLWAGYIQEQEHIAKLATTLVIVVGGFSAYIRFFYGQTHYYRLDTTITGELVTINSRKYLKVRVEAKNIGTAHFYFGNRETGIAEQSHALPHLLTLTLFAYCRFRNWCRWDDPIFSSKSFLMVYKGDGTANLDHIPESVAWSQTPWSTMFLFAEEEWIRSGETSAEEHLIRLPNDMPFACRIQTRIAGRHRFLRTTGHVWGAQTVVILEEDILPDPKPPRKFLISRDP